MNTLDSYIDHLSSQHRKAIKSGISHWILSSANELNRALSYARKNALTHRHMSEDQLKDRQARVESISKELWIQKNSDRQLEAEAEWNLMTGSNNWEPEAAKLFDEACEMVEEGKY